jgi:hypothetical protein
VYAQYYNDISGGGLAVDARNASAGTPAENVVDHLLANGGLGIDDEPMVVVYTEPKVDPETGGTGTGTAVV